MTNAEEQDDGSMIFSTGKGSRRTSHGWFPGGRYVVPTSCNCARLRRSVEELTNAAKAVMENVQLINGKR